MKKIISLVLVLTLMLSLSITAFATEITPSDNNGSKIVTATYVEGRNGGTIYGVDILWGNMVFTYTDASKGTWNADEHKYENGTEAKWSCNTGDNIITVTNHSNVPISVTPNYTAETAYASATMTFDTDKLIVATADNSEGEDGAGKEKTGTITVTAGGTLTKDDKTAASEGTTIGEITLTLKDASVTVTALAAGKSQYTYKTLDEDSRETLNDVTFTATYSDGNTKTLKIGDDGLTVTADGDEFSTTTIGSYSYTATYEGKTCTFTMVVEAGGEAPSV